MSIYPAVQLISCGLKKEVYTKISYVPGERFGRIIAEASYRFTILSRERENK